MKEISINEIEGFRIGNAQDIEGGTGCTVIIAENWASAGVSVEGGGPASRETELLNPKMDAKEINAIILSGGSAYGLNSASGVMKYLEEKKMGFDVGVGIVPLVPGASLFDLSIGDSNSRPDPEMGYKACIDSESRNCTSGNVGAGTGATLGKFMGIDRYMKSGLGSYAVQIGDLKIGAVVAVNCLGDVFDADTGEQIAGTLNETHDGMSSTREAMWNSLQKNKNVFTENTTLGCIICNAKLSKVQCHKLASMSQDGLARVIRPVHSTADGDTVFFMAKGDVDVNQDALGDLATYVISKAINDAVRSAESAYGFKAAKDL